LGVVARRGFGAAEGVGGVAAGVGVGAGVAVGRAGAAGSFGMAGPAVLPCACASRVLPAMLAAKAAMLNRNANPLVLDMVLDMNLVLVLDLVFPVDDVFDAVVGWANDRRTDGVGLSSMMGETC
jgi:hypothetical protein